MSITIADWPNRDRFRHYMHLLCSGSAWTIPQNNLRIRDLLAKIPQDILRTVETERLTQLYGYGAQTSTGTLILQKYTDSFGYKFPQLLEGFVAAGNPRDLAFQITCGSHRSFKWKCLKSKCDHHIWPAQVYNRIRGGGCGFCAGRQTCLCDSFGQKFPQLLEEFVAAGNKRELAFTIPPGSNQSFKWKCLKAKCDHHIWPATVYNRTRGSGGGCGFCAGQQTCLCDSFGQKFPQLLEEFVGAGNDRNIAFTISPGSNQSFNWKCLKAKCDHHIWPAQVNTRTRGSGCKFCHGLQTCSCDSFGYLIPQLLEEFVAAGNPRNLAFTIPPGSSQSFKWKCLKTKCDHHIWPAAVYTRTQRSGCGFCAGRQTCPCDSFGHFFPQLLEEFVGAGNDRNIAFTISPGSDQSFNWKCLKAKCDHHIWSARVNNRTSGTCCPKCAGGNFAREFAQRLDDSKIKYIPEQKFPDCRDQKELPVDFDVYELDALGELDGPQHFEVVYFYGSEGSDLKKQQLHDRIKNDFARKTNKHMFRLSYSEKHNMKKHWEEFLGLVKAAGKGPGRPRIERFYGKEYAQLQQGG